MENDSIDLLLTSPPYADRRSAFYPTIHQQDYPEWMCGWMGKLAPKLKRSGSAAVVIRSQVHKGAVIPYVLRTRLALLEQGWHEPEELIWHKPTAPPVGHIGRPRRSWESILWFSRHPTDVYCNPKANGRESQYIGMDKKVHKKQIEIGLFHQGIPRPEVAGWARCTDIISVGTGENQRDIYNTHPAQFPERLASWIIKLLCPPGGLVVDPFCGSGTTIVAAIQSGCRGLGSDVVEDYVEIAKRRLSFYCKPSEDSGALPLG